MNENDIAQMLRLRCELAEFVGNPYPCDDAVLKLFAEDSINVTFYPGWTERELIATQYRRFSKDEAHYIAEYWLAEWSGIPNLAKERCAKLAEKHSQEQEAEKKAYDKIYGPAPAYREKCYKNFVACDQAVSDDVAEIRDWPYKYPSKDNNEEICWSDGSSFYLNLILAGPPGTGKTHLACALYHDLRGVTFCGAEFIRAETLVRKFKEKEQKESVLFMRYGDGFDDEKNKMDQGCQLLVIDDVGVDTSEYARKILIEIIDRRNAAGRFTVITTNLLKPELTAMFGNRGASRLFHRCLTIGMPDDDFRAREPRDKAPDSKFLK